MTEAKPRVLYIDDDPGLGRLVQKTLESRGYDVVVEASGEAGLRRLEQHRFDVVALDHHMPGQNGLETLPRIRALPEPPPVVYVTGSEDSRVAVAALKAGAIDYVWKDVQGHFRDLLAEAIATALEKERLRRDKEAACGCAGIYTAHAALPLYAEVFEAAGSLDRLEPFASFFGADFYGLPRNTDRVELVRETWQVPAEYDFGGEALTPLRAGETVAWRVVEPAAT